jgi:hypothetical protein
LTIDAPAAMAARITAGFIVSTDTQAPSRTSLVVIWERFPKFVFGFLVGSGTRTRRLAADIDDSRAVCEQRQ